MCSHLVQLCLPPAAVWCPCWSLQTGTPAGSGTVEPCSVSCSWNAHQNRPPPLSPRDPEVRWPSRSASPWSGRGPRRSAGSPPPPAPASWRCSLSSTLCPPACRQSLSTWRSSTRSRKFPLQRHWSPGMTFYPRTSSSSWCCYWWQRRPFSRALSAGLWPVAHRGWPGLRARWPRHSQTGRCPPTPTAVLSTLGSAEHIWCRPSWESPSALTCFS